MLASPLFVREMVATARRGRSYNRRTALAVFALFVLGGNYMVLWFQHKGPLTIADTARFGRWTFSILVILQVFLSVFVVTDLVARSITREREAGSLDALLVSPLSSAQIVLGKLGACLLEFAGVLLSGLPVLALMPLFGGCDPKIVLLAHAGLASTAFAVASFAILVSTRSQTSRVALSKAVGITSLWILLPFPVAMVMPRYWPLFYKYIAGANTWLIISSPFGLFANLMGMLSMGTFIEQFVSMVACELAFGVVCLVAAIVSLRPVSRRLGEGTLTSRIRALRRWRFRLWRRPACGDDPVLWKELFTTHAAGLSQLIGIVTWLGVFGLAVAVFLFLAQPSLEELSQYGYWSPGRDDYRTEFNAILRCGTMVFYLVYSLVLTGLCSERIGLERARQTWVSLLTTPLSGAEILRGYRRGMTLRLGGFAVGGVALWLFGMAAGAIHPIAFVAAVTYLYATTLFCSALGTSLSLWARDSQSSGSVSMSVLMILLTLALLSFIPSPLTSIIWSVASPPAMASEALLSFRDVRKAFGPAARVGVSPFPALTTAPAWLLCATYFASVIGLLVAAPLLNRFAAARFDARVGRPKRPTKPALSTEPDLPPPPASAPRQPSAVQGCLNRALTI